MNPPNQPPAPHSASNGFDTSINPTPPTFLGYGLPQQATAPATVALNQFQVQPRQPHNCLINYRTWLRTQPTQAVHRPNVPPVPSKPKRVRTGFTTQQLIVLEKEYARVPYLPRPQRIELAELLQLTERTIKIWFQNRRMKAKREKLEDSEDIQELMVPYPEVVQTYPAITPPIRQNIILEQRPHPVSTYGFTNSVVHAVNSNGTISLNSSLTGLVQDFKHANNQQHSNIQYKHPVTPTIQMQSSQNFIFDQHKYTPGRNGVTQPVMRPVNCQRFIGSISSSYQGNAQDLQFNKQQHSSLLYGSSAAATAQMQNSQNFIPKHQYPSWTNGATQKMYHPVVSNETITSKISLLNNFQNLQHDRLQYSNVQNRHPAAGTAAQNLILEPYHPAKIQNGSQPEDCSMDSIKTVPLKVFEDFYEKTMLDKQNSCEQYGQPVTSNGHSSQNSISEQGQYSPRMYREPSPIVHLEFSEESCTSRSSIEDIYQDLIRSAQQYLETKQRRIKQMPSLDNFIPEQYSPSMNGATQYTVSLPKQFHLFQTDSLLPEPDLPSDLLDVTPMKIEDIDMNLYFFHCFP